VDVSPRTEIHAHVLPGVDDGARDLDESVEMARTAAEHGTRLMVATPHVREEFLTDVSVIPGLVAELRTALRADGIDIAVHAGGELGHQLAGSLDGRELETIAVGPPGGRWVLLEAPFEGLDESFAAAADELRARGYGVVIAHPERAVGVLGTGGEVLLREIERGSLLQVNHWSLSGGHGAEAEAAAKTLLQAAMVAALASDAHPGWRRPTLSVGVEAAVDAGLAPATAESLVATRPERLVRLGFPAQALTGAS
jgi:protein-tyrosine phosphatase